MVDLDPVKGPTAYNALPGGAVWDNRSKHFRDELGAIRVVLHAPFGGRINRGWGLALRKRFCRFPFGLSGEHESPIWRHQHVFPELGLCRLHHG